jgi:myo-inositol-1(or 4)-monophosphatase
MQGFKKAIVAANIEILKLIKSNRHDFLCEKVSLGYGGDMSMNIDLLAEDIFIKYLGKFGNIYSEECGFIDNNSKYDLIIDPIDGSANFASNFPYFATSVALKDKDTYISSAIVNLANGDLFFKDKNSFTKENLHNKICQQMQINHNSSVGIFERSYCSKTIAKKLQIKYRSPGAIALSLAHAKDVDFVIYEGVLRAFDVEAGLYMCEDLYLYKNDDILLISKDKETFDKISELF